MNLHDISIIQYIKVISERRMHLMDVCNDKDG